MIEPIKYSHWEENVEPYLKEGVINRYTFDWLTLINSMAFPVDFFIILCALINVGRGISVSNLEAG